MRVLTVVLLFTSCALTSPSDSRTRGGATEAYHQRLSQIIDSTPVLAADKLTAYLGASIHFSFRIDAAGRTYHVSEYLPSEHRIGLQRRS